MRVGVRIASPSVCAGANGAGALQASPVLATTLRTSENPLECTPEEASPMMTSPCAISARGSTAPRSTAPTAKAGEIVVVALVEPGHFRGLAADQRAAGLAAADADAGDHGGADLGLEFSTRVVVEKEQGFGALHHQVVDRHGDQIDADGVVAAGLDGDLDLGADAVIGGHQDRVGKAGPLEVEQPAKAADFRIGPGRAVARTSGLISSTIRLPASISTPACA